MSRTTLTIAPILLYQNRIRNIKNRRHVTLRADDFDVTASSLKLIIL